MGYTGVGNAGASALSDALKVNKTLRHLFLVGNSVDDDGAAFFAGALKENETLQCASPRAARGGLRSIALLPSLDGSFLPQPFLLALVPHCQL